MLKFSKALLRSIVLPSLVYAGSLMMDTSHGFLSPFGAATFEPDGENKKSDEKIGQHFKMK